MAPSPFPTTLLFLLTEALLLVQPTLSLHIGKASPCYDQCDGGSLTVTQDLSCLDAAYDETSGTAAGKQMRECLTCTETSDYANSSDTATDQYWFMFHLKYTQQYCLFDASANQIDDCATECSPLQSVLTTLWGDTTPPRYLYDYCDATSGVYPNYAPDCAACLKNRTGTVILGNFMDTMYSACATQPNVTTDGELFEIRAANGDLFDTQTESASEQSAPTATDSSASVPSSSASQTGSAADEAASNGSSGSSSSSDSANSSSSSSSSDDDSGLSTGATAGIAVGCTIIGIGAIAGLVFLIMRRRRAARNHNSHLEDKMGPNAGLMGGVSPAATAHGYGQSPMGVSPNGAYGEQAYAMEKQKQYPGQAGYGAAPVEMSGQSVVSEMPANGPAAVELPVERRR
ncbi:uncharacterized protein HMPREF1541_01850 [Cyphellophora europaea CBS 101466]|uniref:LPXTG-domain-containing protein n=1 Tax=Cyphellophora europaea (strain CBS 101466) TaxID=1220924 RepID=W2S1Y0_CYPE1|nr:uncharacterized protein HMPREF1541_01850 [Cyphellophora europaea CBS 101466]ETN42692.1 hypothetical protein HMPREF1541_01850 [Cyphellophora europaea CBS 101466]